MAEDPASGDDARGRSEAAKRYRPERVALLLVGHAPPGSLERYFYFERVREKDDLFRYVVKGLFGAFPERSDKPLWLSRLKGAGVFLVDLLERPYDGSVLALHVPGLIDRARRLDPEHVVLVKVDVFDAAYRPLHAAGLPVVAERIPFPGSGQQLHFEASFASALRTIGWSAPAPS